MGNIFSFSFWTQKKPARILLLGLDGAGKTTILYKLMGDDLQTIPTIGFNLETITSSNSTTMEIKDVGGQQKIRPLWRRHFQGIRAIIFVIDSSDIARMDEAKNELSKLLRIESLKNSIILIFANKQDLPTAMEVKEIEGRLNLEDIIEEEENNNRNNKNNKNNRKLKWQVQECSGVTGMGLSEGVDWLANYLK